MKSISNILFALLALPLLCVPLAGCDRSESSTQPERSPVPVRSVQVSVSVVEPTTIRDVVVLPGETEAWEDVRVASDMTGRVEWIGPREGETVQKGQLLARIDESSLKAALDRAQAAYELADEVYQRRQILLKKDLLSQEERDRSLTERALAKANLSQAEVEYERAFLRSPIEGAINRLFVDAGEFIERGKPMLDLVNVDKIKINASVPELDVGYLKVGQKVPVRIDALPGREFPGVVDFVAYKADPTTKTFHVRVVIENPGHSIRPGMIARAAFLRRIIPNALVAPLFSLVDKGGERILFVEKEGVARARTVSTGVIEGDRIQITSGLAPGDRLIVKGQTEVEEGMKVQVR